MVADRFEAKFHYAIWSQTGPRLVADLLARASSRNGISLYCSVENKYRLSLTNPARDALHHGNMLQTKVDAQCDKLATELS